VITTIIYLMIHLSHRKLGPISRTIPPRLAESAATFLGNLGRTIFWRASISASICDDAIF